MSEAGVERRLTTILASDVVGYSRLMAADEAGTLAQLKTHRKELIEPKTAEYHGRVVKLMGDGTLMEFGSVGTRCTLPSMCSKPWRNEMPRSQKIGGSSTAWASTSATSLSRARIYMATA